MIPIFLYHQVAHVPVQNDPVGLAVTPQQFEQHMDYLHRNGHTCLSLGDAVRCMKGERSTPPKAFVITFDDGFWDLYTTAWPILDRYGFTATIFYVAGCAGRPSDWAGQDGNLAAPLMSWDEAREMAQAGFTFGSHTVTHTRLTTLDDDAARYELQASKTMIQDQLGAPVDFFSYPYSAHTEVTRNIVSESGYTAACGGDRGEWGLFNLWREQCGRQDTARSFALKARGLYYTYFRLRQQPLAQKLKNLRRRRADG